MRMDPDAGYGWVNVGDGIELPYVIRPPRQKFVPVKLIDRLILRHYPNSYPRELTEKPPLICQFLNSQEARRLSSLCEVRFNSAQLVGTLDPIVNLQEFQVFYDIVRKTYPDVRIKRKSDTSAPVVYGWLLFKDAMIPYIERNDMFLLPLNVVQGAAQLLVGMNIQTIAATAREVECLNTMCQKAGMTFCFQKDTGLVDLTTIAMLSPGCPIRQLPPDDPLSGLVSPAVLQEGGTPPELAALYNLPPPPPLLPINMMPIQMSYPAQPPTVQDQVSQVQLPTHPKTTTQQAPLVTQHPSDDHPGKSSDDAPPKVPSADTPPQQLEHGAMPQSPVSRDDRDPVDIKSVDCFGKTISCITRGKLKTKYALVEAVCRVFFSQVNLLDFVHYLENDLSVKLYSLKKPEEAAFIVFFGIPTDQLRCNLLIKLKEFMERMTWLRERFGSVDTPEMLVPKNTDETENGDDAPDLEPLPKVAEELDHITPKSSSSDRVCLERAVDKLKQKQQELGIQHSRQDVMENVGSPVDNEMNNKRRSSADMQQSPKHRRLSPDVVDPVEVPLDLTASGRVP